MNMQSELEKMLGDLKDEVGDTSIVKQPHSKKEIQKEEDVDRLLGELSSMFKQNTKEKSKPHKKKEATAETLSSISDEKLKKLFPPEKEEKDNKKKAHILVVDDDIRVLKMVQEILKTEYRVSVAPNGMLALRFLERHGADLILLDYMMPEKSGKEVLEEIHANPVLSNIPVFFLTGVADKEKVKECLQLRPKGYLLKPVKREELLKKIKAILG